MYSVRPVYFPPELGVIGVSFWSLLGDSMLLKWPSGYFWNFVFLDLTLSVSADKLLIP